MGVQIRIARDKKKQQNSHRDFNDFERMLNKLTTSAEFYEEFKPKVDIYSLRTLSDKHFKNDTFSGNPFRSMPEHRLKSIAKYMEHTQQWQRDMIEPIINVSRWIFLFKDITHLTTSECLALAIETQKQIQNSNPKLIKWLEDDNYKSEDSAHQVTDIIHSVLADFQEHWELYMAQIERMENKTYKIEG
jgi:hypothetical protein